MNGPAAELLPFGDLLMWIGIALTGTLGLVAMLAPRWLRQRDTQRPRM